jgi:phenylacetate-CoA ligase
MHQLRPPSDGSPPSATRLLGEVNRATRDNLRSALLYACSTFAVYDRLFQEVGISHDDLLNQDSVAVLQRLPLLHGQRFYDLADESISSAGQIVDMETSSGTTGARKRRVITQRDEASETRFLAVLFGVCGIGRSDSVACVDTGPLTLMVSFTKALEHLGVAEAYAYCVSPDVESTMETLARLDPSAIVTIPSILDRYLPGIKARLGTLSGQRLSKIVYVGEPLSRHTRSILESELGFQVYAYYGASETSALGIECRAHDGVHLFTDRNIIELVPTGSGGNVGEIVVTTLWQEGLPLLRYALKDLVEVKDGACKCGLDYPRVDVIGRTDGTVSVLGAKVSYAAIREAVYHGLDGEGHMEVILTRDGQERMTVTLPDRLSVDRPRIRRSLLRMEPDLAYLVGSGLLSLDLDFVDEGRFGSSRKNGRIVDRRGSDDGADR